MVNVAFFIGPDGSGKDTAARRFADKLNHKSYTLTFASALRIEMHELFGRGCEDTDEWYEGFKDSLHGYDGCFYTGREWMHILSDKAKAEHGWDVYLNKTMNTMRKIVVDSDFCDITFIFTDLRLPSEFRALLFNESIVKIEGFLCGYPSNRFNVDLTSYYNHLGSFAYSEMWKSSSDPESVLRVPLSLMDKFCEEHEKLFG